MLVAHFAIELARLFLDKISRFDEVSLFSLEARASTLKKAGMLLLQSHSSDDATLGELDSLWHSGMFSDEGAANIIIPLYEQAGEFKKALDLLIALAKKNAHPPAVDYLKRFACEAPPEIALSAQRFLCSLMESSFTEGGDCIVSDHVYAEWAPFWEGVMTPFGLFTLSRLKEQYTDSGGVPGGEPYQALLEKSADGGLPAALIHRGNSLISAGEVDDGIAMLRQVSLQGFPEGEYWEGVYLSNNARSRDDLLGAFSLLKQSFDRGFKRAGYILGSMKQDGYAMPCNWPEALSFYRAALEVSLERDIRARIFFRIGKMGELLNRLGYPRLISSEEVVSSLAKSARLGLQKAIDVCRFREIDARLREPRDSSNAMCRVIRQRVNVFDLGYLYSLPEKPEGMLPHEFGSLKRFILEALLGNTESGDRACAIASDFSLLVPSCILGTRVSH
jgi:hypothetical protein